ncbi:MAG: hypothetical protein ACUVQY_11345 [Thermoproteota archaeon]
MLTSDLDVSVSLAEHLKDSKLVAEKLLIVKEKNSLNCIIKPKTFLGYEAWRSINSWVHRQGGKWHSKEKLWTIPLQRKP